MKAIKFIAAFVLMLVIATTTNAQATGRIRQGVRNGELTRHESRQLERQQRNIRREKRAAHADGVVTAKERREIRRDHRRASRNIHRKRHNRRNSI